MSLISDIHNDLENSAIQLIAEYRARLFADAIRLCDNQASADDLVSRTFLKVISNIDQHRPDADFYSWMKAIMVNIHRNDLARPVARGTTPVSSDALETYAGTDNSTDEQILRNSDEEVVREALRHIDPEFKQLVLMRYYDEFSLKEIAGILNKPIGTIGRRIQIAHRLLAGKLSAKLGKKPLSVLLAALLGIGTLFGAWVSPLGDWVAEKVFGSAPAAQVDPVSTSPVIAFVSGEGIICDAGAASEKESAPNGATRVDKNSTSEMKTQEGEDTVNSRARIQKTVATAACAAVGLGFSAMAGTSASYVQDGLIAQWDGIENAGRGQHKPSPAVWKDLKGSYDLTVTPRSGGVGGLWGETYLDVAGSSAVGASSAPAYRTIEIAYRMTSADGRILFCSGTSTRWLIFDLNGTKAYFDGSRATPYVPFTFSANADRQVASIYGENNAVVKVCNDGAVLANPGSNNNPWGVGDGKIMLGDRAKAGSNYKWYGRVYAIRLYDRELTEDQIYQNAAIDDARFFGRGRPDVLNVRSLPEECSEATADTPFLRGLKAGDVVVLPVSANWMNAAQTVRAICAGYQFRVNGEVREEHVFAEGEPREATYPAVEADDIVELVWQWRAVEDKVMVTAMPGGSVSKIEEWVPSGDNFTVTATPADDSHVFYRWADVNGMTVSTDAVLSLPITGPVELTAEFGGSYFVAMDGSEENDGLTRETPRADLEKLVSELPGGSTVYVAEGDYDIHSKWLMLTNAIRLVGSDDPSKTKIRANPKSVSSDNKWRVLYMNNPGAFVTGFTLRDGRWQGYNYGDYGPGNLRLAAGIVSNCLITAGNGSVECCGGVEILGGLLTHSRIFANNADKGSSNWSTGYGGGIRIKGGTVEYCVISNNTSVGTGIGVYQEGGTNRFNVICNQENTAVSGAGVCITGGLMDRCEIVSNSGSASTVNQSGGTVRNCFIHDNTVVGEGGGATLTGGTIEYCTLVNNKSTEVKTGGIYLNRASDKNAVAQYCVTYLNGDESANPSCNLKVAAGTATAVISADPSFANPNAGDFTPGAGSAAIDAGEEEREDVAVDFAGNVRPKDGNGDHIAANDCGCFEAPDANEGPMRCSFMASQTRAHDSMETTFTASVGGSGSEGPVTYSWDFDGDGTFDRVGTGDEYKSVTTTYSAYGYYDVVLKTSNGDNAVVTTNKDCIGIGTSTLYVNAANAANAKWPYATWETAAADINVAYDTVLWTDGVAPTVIVTNGTYDITSKWLMLQNAITLKSVEGPDKTTLRAHNPESAEKRRVLLVDHPDAWVEGFKLTEANWQGYNYGDQGVGALRLKAGVVTNCIFASNQGQVGSSGGAEVLGGLLTHCVFRGNTANQGTSSTAQADGGGLRVAGGIVEYCVITNNYNNKHVVEAQYGKGAGLCLCGADAIVRNCMISDNYCTWKNNDNNRDFEGSQVWVSDGLLENCTIGNMEHDNVYASGVYQTGGTIRNCLLKGMYSGNAVQALKVEGGSFYNNTVVTNGFGQTVHAAPVAAQVTGGEVVNCIFAANVGAVTDDSGLVRNSCYPDADGAHGNLAADPKLCNPAHGDWRIRSSSPCVNAGDNDVWADVEDPVDFIGKPRILNKVVDIGCYECALRGLVIFFK